MSKNKKKAKKPVSKASVAPVWDKQTWMSISNVKLGVPAFVVAGALDGYSNKVKLSEAEVRVCIQTFLAQTL